MIGINFVIIPCPFVNTFLDINPAFVLIDYLILPNACYRSLYLIAFSLPFSLLANIILMYTIFKYLFVMQVYLIMLGLQLKQYVQALLLFRNHTEPELLSFYMIVSVMFMIIREFLCQQISYELTFAQGMLLLLAWLSINAFKSLPMFIVAATVTAFAGGIGIVVFLLRILLFARLYSKQLVNRKRKGWTMYANKKITYYYTVKWKAQMELQLT